MKNLRSNHAAGVRVGIGGEQDGERDGCKWCHGEFPGASRPFWLGRRRKRAVEDARTEGVGATCESPSNLTARNVSVACSADKGEHSTNTRRRS